MSDEQAKPLNDEQLIKGLNREAMFTVAPERMKLYGDAAARIAQLNERIAELEAIVEKLPRTADGVIIVPGMDLYGYGRSVSGRRYESNEKDICLAGYSGDYYDPHPIDPSNLYSTPEAAEAASQEGGG